jgi:hypothetical protein
MDGENEIIKLATEYKRVRAIKKNVDQMEK